IAKPIRASNDDYHYGILRLVYVMTATVKICMELKLQTHPVDAVLLDCDVLLPSVAVTRVVLTFKLTVLLVLIVARGSAVQPGGVMLGPSLGGVYFSFINVTLTTTGIIAPVTNLSGRCPSTARALSTAPPCAVMEIYVFLSFLTISSSTLRKRSFLCSTV